MKFLVIEREFIDGEEYNSMSVLDLSLIRETKEHYFKYMSNYKVEKFKKFLDNPENLNRKMFSSVHIPEIADMRLDYFNGEKDSFKYFTMTRVINDVVFNPVSIYNLKQKFHERLELMSGVSHKQYVVVLDDILYMCDVKANELYRIDEKGNLNLVDDEDELDLFNFFFVKGSQSYTEILGTNLFHKANPEYIAYDAIYTKDGDSFTINHVDENIIEVWNHSKDKMRYAEKHTSVDFKKLFKLA